MWYNNIVTLDVVGFNPGMYIKFECTINLYNLHKVVYGNLNDHYSLGVFPRKRNKHDETMWKKYGEDGLISGIKLCKNRIT